MPTASARFHLIYGNRLDRLAAHLGTRLTAPATADPSGEVSLQPDVVLIPQPALRHWLQQALAERYGVAANLDLCTPSEFVWRLLRAARPDLPDASPWDRERLRWQLYALLGDSSATLPSPVARHLRRTVVGDPADAIGAVEHALGRYALADALAAAYDRYQAYRPDWLRDWERNAPASRDDWQAQLWRSLRQRLKGSPHRAALLGEWLTRHDREAEGFAGIAPPGLPPRVAAFGTIHVSPDVLHMLAVVGQWVELDFYLPMPSAEYWGDVESLRERLRRDGVQALPLALAEAQQDNPLLTAWGAGGREIAAQLFSYDVLLPHTEVELFAAPGRDTLLHRLQQDVLDRAPPRREAFDPGDRSLQLHACHSKLREVEVLHDQLRALLDDPSFDPPLQPRDIAVLAPDIADYLPLARSVFGGLSPDDPRYIPFSLADRPQSQSHPLIGLLLDLLSLADAPLTAGLFRDLLASPPIAHALRLDSAQRARLDDWCEAAGIRWGEDETARERVGVGRWREYSFDFGFDRLLAGYAAGDDALIDADAALPIAPYPELEGADAEVLDRALSLYRRLREFAAWMREDRIAQDWRERLSGLLQGLLAPIAQDDAEAQARRLLSETLDDFAQEAADAGPLPAVLVRRALRDALSRPSPHRPWLSGGVTFAGMVPLRTVPFRVICLLGLDADAYPRREPADDINRLVDAIQGRALRRLGDRSVRDDDRFLFLQLLCAAGDVFYLSYGGRDARDGSVREPSPVIGELLDAVEAMHGDATRDALCVVHPLQPFSPRAFGAGDDGGVEPRRFSYRKEWRATASPTGAPTMEAPFANVALPSDDVGVPDRETLQRFFAHPAKLWLHESLGLRLPRVDEARPDREPLGSDALLRWQVLDAALVDERGDPQEDASGLDGLAAHLRARALLPPGRDGVALARDAGDVRRQLRAARAQLCGATPATCVQGDTGLGIDTRFDDVHVDDAQGGLRVLLSAGSLDGKRRLRAGIDHLLLAALLGEAATTRLIAIDRKKGALIEAVWRGVSQAQARARLQCLLGWWREGRSAPLPFAPKAAFAYAQSFGDKRDPMLAWRAAWAAYAPFNGGGEHDDPWLALAFRPQGLLAAFDDPCSLRFRDLALQVFDAVGTGG